MQLTDVIKTSGIVGCGGVGFPAHVKLSQQAEYFIVNAAECEPLLEVDKYLIRERAKDLIRGIDLIGRHVSALYKYIAIKKHYQEEISCLKAAIAETKSDIRIFEIDGFYPAGDEQVLVYEVTKRVVPERSIPLNVGVIVNNVGTVLAIFDAKQDAQVVTHKYVSIIGDVKCRIILKVPIGTSVKDCIKKAEPNIMHYGFIMGGPMRGSVYTHDEMAEDVVITKTDSNIIVLPLHHPLITRETQSIKKIKSISKSTCIGCRICTDLCPRQALGHTVKPHQIMHNLYHEDGIEDDLEYIKIFGSAINCTECGICELFACPMMLSPRRANRYIKTQLKEKNLQVPPYKVNKVDPQRDYKKIPTNRLMFRLGLNHYSQNEPISEVLTISSKSVRIPLKQHVGMSSTPIVTIGQSVKEGDLIAQVQGESLGANIHASIDGIVTQIDNYIEIEAQ